MPVFYEAAVAGGIPIIKSVREAFVGNRFEAIHGILNGTSNYILTRMTEEGADFAPVLADAQRLGYAEADPALDVNGWDAAHKAIILASLFTILDCGMGRSICEDCDPAAGDFDSFVYLHSGS